MTEENGVHAFGSLADGITKMRPEGEAHAYWVSGGKCWGSQCGDLGGCQMIGVR